MVQHILFLAQVREPYPPPPIIFDLILSVVFAWVGWLAWKPTSRPGMASKNG